FFIGGDRLCEGRNAIIRALRPLQGFHRDAQLCGGAQRAFADVLRLRGTRPKAEAEKNAAPDHRWINVSPVISSGFSSPMRSSSVGARSARRPLRRLTPSGPPTRPTGTRLVVWAVWGPPVTGSIITSQLP